MTVTYQQEFLASCRDEAEVLIKEHWEEIALNKEKIKLNPDWDAYEELEKRQGIKVFTARDSGKLVGYFVVFIGKNIHYKDHIFATNDIIFLTESYRKGFLGANLIKFSRDCLKDDGVSVLNINTKVHKPFDSLMERLGFKLIERVYSIYLGD